MENYEPTTPFGRRKLSLAQIAAGAGVPPPDAAVHKWQVFRDLCAAKDRLGVTERALAVLNALLTFHPEIVLSGEGLIVFPSNAQLAHRAHGMAPATLRRHLGVLVEAGLILRRDSPNGKRYARKARDGTVDRAFGFDLMPLVARASEFARIAAEIRAEEEALKRARERLTLLRRDIAKLIAAGIEECVPVRRGASFRDWAEAQQRYRAVLAGLPRTATRAGIEAAAGDLAGLATEIRKLLECHAETKNPSASESQTERHKQNSKPETSRDLEPRLQEGRGEGQSLDNERTSPPPLMVPEGASAVRPLRGRPAGIADRPAEQAGSGTVREPGPGESSGGAVQAYPLGMVMSACPDLAAYARDGISNWRDFTATASFVRPMLGISPSAWDEALEGRGDIPAAIVVACLLQKGEQVANPGG